MSKSPPAMELSLTDQMLEIMYRALGEPVGLLVQTNDLKRAQATFYAARRKACDPALAVLECRGSPIPGGDLIIVKGAKQMPKAFSAEELDL